jgi:hypothetical protein
LLSSAKPLVPLLAVNFDNQLPSSIERGAIKIAANNEKTVPVKKIKQAKEKHRTKRIKERERER